MAPLQLLRRTLARLPSKTLNPRSPSDPLRSPHRSMSFSIAEARRSSFHEHLIRLLRSEIDYETRAHPPREPAKELDSFAVEERPGEQWVRMRRGHGEEEEITVDATMFDGFVTRGSKAADSDAYGKLHISLVVDVEKKHGGCNGMLQFLCSAWPDALVVKRVFFYKHNSNPVTPYMGPKFRELNEEFQEAIIAYLGERGIDDDFAGLLHGYMNNKDKDELIKWMENVTSFIEKSS